MRIDGEIFARECKCVAGESDFSRESQYTLLFSTLGVFLTDVIFWLRDYGRAPKRWKWSVRWGWFINMSTCRSKVQSSSTRPRTNSRKRVTVFDYHKAQLISTTRWKLTGVRNRYTAAYPRWATASRLVPLMDPARLLSSKEQQRLILSGMPYEISWPPQRPTIFFATGRNPSCWPPDRWVGHISSSFLFL